MARYQFRLNLRKGRMAAKVSASSCFIRRPLKNARGNQMREQILRQKLSRTLRRLMNASNRSYQPEFSGGVWRRATSGAGMSAWVPEETVGVPGAGVVVGRVGPISSGNCTSN